MFDLDKVDQGHGVQLSQWRPSMENIKMYKNRKNVIFELALSRFRECLNCLTLNAMDYTFHSDIIRRANRKIYFLSNVVLFIFFPTRSHRFGDITISDI